MATQSDPHHAFGDGAVSDAAPGDESTTGVEQAVPLLSLPSSNHDGSQRPNRRDTGGRRSYATTGSETSPFSRPFEPTSDVSEDESMCDAAPKRGHTEPKLHGVAASARFTSLTERWERRETIGGGTRYYVDHVSMTTTWEPPPGATETPEARSGGKSTSSSSRPKIREYLSRLEAESARSFKHELKPTSTGRTRCCLLSKDLSELRGLDVPQPKAITYLGKQDLEGTDCVCIVENIDKSWLAALGHHLDLPTTFLLWHLERQPAPTGGIHTAMQKQARELFHMMDDIMELCLGCVQSKTLEDDTVDPRDRSVLQLLDELSESLASAKSIVAAWGVAGPRADVEDIMAKCSAHLETMQSIRNSLRNSHAQLVPSMAASIDKLEKTLEVFTSRRHGNWYSLAAYVEDPLSKDQVLSTKGGVVGAWERSKVSYIRPRKTLLLILVDGPEYILHNRPGVVHTLHADQPEWMVPSRLNYRFSTGLGAHGYLQGALFPELLNFGTSGMYERLKHVASELWRHNILCGEEEMPFEDDGVRMGKLTTTRRDRNTSRYAAIDPQAFLHFVSSCVWEQNMRYLEAQTRLISFRRFDGPDTQQQAVELNNELNVYRRDLDNLTRQVTDADAQMPIYLVAYYNNFPLIRWRHQAKNRSPIDHLGNILQRASNLERLLIDSFQMLMSSVSVQQATISAEQTKASNEQLTLNNLQAATTARLADETAKQARGAFRITVLAFVYIPLTFVTGIFGMNIRVGGKPEDGFIWYGPLIAFVVAILFTVSLWFATPWIERRIGEWRKKKEKQAAPDIEKQVSKAKSE